MPAFVSIDGKLALPAEAHPEDPKYKPITVGEPVCIEIVHMAFGNVKDWWGKSEMLVSSWAKTGSTAKPGARLVNALRKKIPQFYHLSDLGASEYGHQLVFYMPVYSDETIRFSIEFLEIDKLGGDGISKLGNALKGLGTLPVFAPQLAYLALAPEILKLGQELYNIINRNDQILLEHLDLGRDPDGNILSSGRYVLVRGNYNPLKFIEDYKLLSDNKLYTQDGRLAEEAGMTDAYVVVRVNAVEKKEYKDFEATGAAQEILDTVLNQNVTASVADLITDIVKDSQEFGTVKKVLDLDKQLAKATTDDEKKRLKTAIETELKKLSDDQAGLLREALKL
ncbi:MAG: hypothetical protein JSS81_10960 [Acidobacteria bacterium]|nr:hypothetical protein [Acidobacteriota bacterium]